MNKKLSLIMLLPVFSLGAYCESGNCPLGNTRSGNYYYLEENMGPSRNYGYRRAYRNHARNPQLMQRIRTELSGEGSLRSYPNVQVVMVEGGVVTLRGVVPTARDVNDIERRIRNMPGVRDVIIEIDVREDRSYGRNARRYSNNGYQNESMMNGNVDDRSLKENIQAKLTDTWFAKSYPNVRVVVVNGIVTLRGTVDTVEDIEEVEERVRDVSGVQDVRVEIDAQDWNQSNRFRSTNGRNSSIIRENISDKPLKEKLQSQLSSYPDVEVMVVDGVVTLEGTVPTERDINEIVKRVRSISGVRDLEVEIDVED